MGTYNEKIATNPKVELIHVSADTDKKDAEEWAKKEKFPWPTVLPDDVKRSGLDKYAGSGVPHYVLIDKDGKQIAEGQGEVLGKVQELTGPPAKK